MVRDVAMDQRVGDVFALDRSNPSQHLCAQGGHRTGHSPESLYASASTQDRLRIVSLFQAGASPERIHDEIGRLELWHVYAVIARHLLQMSDSSLEATG